MVVRPAFFERGARGERVLTASSGPHGSALGRGQARSPRWSEVLSKPWERVAREWVAMAAVSTGVTKGSGSRFRRLLIVFDFLGGGDVRGSLLADGRPDCVREVGRPWAGAFQINHGGLWVQVSWAAGLVDRRIREMLGLSHAVGLDQ